MASPNSLPTPHIQEDDRYIVATFGEEGPLLEKPRQRPPNLLAIPREFPSIGHAWFGILPEEFDVIDRDEYLQELEANR